jgi:N-acetylmuramoyl-L-alanine amidase
MRWIKFALAACLLLSTVTAAPDEKRISIYSPVADYSLNIAERDGKDYVGLLEILEPLGTVSAKPDGDKWKLRFNDTEGQFTNGSNKVRMRGHDLDLTGGFLIENKRGLVPVDSLVTLLPQFLGIPVVLHVNSRRLFISQNGTTYTADMSKSAPSKLVLNFSAPVNPTIGTEPGKLRMLFLRDPLVASGPETVNYNDKQISSANFQETNGAAELTVSGSVPLLASFSNDGRTITIAPAPAAPATAAATPAATPQTSQAPAQLPPGPNQTPGKPARIFAVIDPSHGGDERGAAFSDTLLEKDVTLSLARRLRQELVNKGMSAMLLRDSDIAIPVDQRASAANSAHPAIYINLHAASDGTGVRVYTAVIPPGIESRGPFLGWQAAQTPALGLSQMAASSVATELRKKVSTRMLEAPVRPLNSITSTAVSIEIAPQEGDIADLSSADYQQTIANSVAAGLAAVRDKLEAH